VTANDGRRLELNRARDLTALFSDSLKLLRSHLGVFLALSAVVVVPVHLIVSGIGLGQLTGRYDPSPTLAESLIPVAVSYLVVAPLINAICIKVLQSIANGDDPSPGRSIVEGFEAFTPLFFAVLLAAVGITLGLFLFIVPGIYIAVRWFFVPQAVVIEGASGPTALAQSMRLTEGFWWRTFGIVLVANLAAALPGLLLTLPAEALGKQSGEAFWSLAGTILTELITTPFVALIATLLYYDLRARRAGAAL
jgi:hypothetical protein